MEYLHLEGLNHFDMKFKFLLIFIFVSAFCAISCNNNGQDDKNSARKALEAETKIAQVQLIGRKVDPVTKAVACALEGNDLVYTYEIDESQVDFETLLDLKDTMQENFKNMWDARPEVKATKKNLKAIDGKVHYKYVGNQTGRTMTITIDMC